MFERYAVFYCPTGDLAKFGAAWLGWDSAAGQPVEHPLVDVPDIAALTRTPRKYGLHATLKAPFHLAEGSTFEHLRGVAQTCAKRLSVVDVGPLTLQYKNGFIALRPGEPQPALRGFAAEIVRAFDLMRAPPDAAEIARRRKARLSIRQDAQMLEWGYPYIFDDFHFHLTLTGRIKPDAAHSVLEALDPHLTPLLPDPFQIEAITLAGQDSEGLFHQIERFTLMPRI